MSRVGLLPVPRSVSVYAYTHRNTCNVWFVAEFLHA